MGLISYTFFSNVLREQVKVSVVLPTYNQWSTKESIEEFYNKGKKYKTLYVLHGGSDDCTTYYRNTNIERYADNNGFAAIMPEVKNSYYSNMKHGPNYFDYLSKELVNVMQTVFPLSDKGKDHYVVGNSMGSHGAFKWALNCPNFFNAAAGMSGVGDAEEMGFFKGRALGRAQDAFGTVDDYRDSMNDFKKLSKDLVKSGKQIPRLFSCCGTEDPYYQGTLLFKKYADKIGLPLTYKSGPGGHTWEFWDLWLPRIIDWMGLSAKEEDS